MNDKTFEEWLDSEILLKHSSPNFHSPAVGSPQKYARLNMILTLVMNYLEEKELKEEWHSKYKLEIYRIVKTSIAFTMYESEKLDEINKLREKFDHK